MHLHLDGAYAYYQEHILNEDRFRRLEAHGLSVAGSVAPIDWELFGAILTRDTASAGYGSDLTRHEVKSAVQGNSFEYQYHLNGGMQKLEEDMVVRHVYISYSRTYRDVTVRTIEGAALRDTFEGWRAGLVDNYEREQPRQRYRKSVSYGTVVRLGRIEMEIRDGRRVGGVAL